VQEIKDCLRVVIELRGLFLDERIGGVGVGRRGQQARVDAPCAQGCRGRRVGNGAGIERGEGVGTRVERQGRRAGPGDRQGDAGTVEPLDRPQAPGEVLAALVGRLEALANATPGASVVVRSTPVSGSAFSL